MYSASVVVNLTKDTIWAVNKAALFGSLTTSSISNYEGSAVINLPATMHDGTASKTYIIATQLDTGAATRAKLSISYSVASNCQTATIYFRDTTRSIPNGFPVSISYIVTQDIS